jgi:hypothetical protein
LSTSASFSSKNVKFLKSLMIQKQWLLKYKKETIITNLAQQFQMFSNVWPIL